MPKIHGTSIVGILAASIGFYFVGFLWYGFIFMEKWMTLQALPMDGEQQMMPMIWGFLITVVQVIGINCGARLDAYLVHHERNRFDNYLQ